MEESNISNKQNDVSNMKNQTLFLYHTELKSLPNHIVFRNISELDDSITNYQHILIQDLCDFYSEKEIVNLLTSIIDKMTNGSKLEIQGIDLYQLCVAFINDDINEELIKGILYSRKNIYNMHDMQNYLIDLGLMIDNKKFINIFEYNIIAIK